MPLQLNFTGFEQQLLLNEKPFYAAIYEGEGDVPEGFNVVCIKLDASLRSLLSWNEALLSAQDLVSKGFLILWELNFSLQEQALDGESLFLTLQLNIQHFNDLVWKQFQDATFGASLFKGRLEEGMIDYIKSLASILPDELSCFLCIDTSSANDLASYFVS